jgi:hypothetical protein
MEDSPRHAGGTSEWQERVDGRVPSDPEVLERLVQFAPKYGLEVLGPSPL